MLTSPYSMPQENSMQASPCTRFRGADFTAQISRCRFRGAQILGHRFRCDEKKIDHQKKDAIEKKDAVKKKENGLQSTRSKLRKRLVLEEPYVANLVV